MRNKTVQLFQVFAGRPPNVMREIVLAVLEAIEESPTYPPLVVKRVGGRFIFPDLERIPATVRRVFREHARMLKERG
ncbi:hypothetical protein LCGC14_1408340 [marine sediment metagenome]|uniref:Uncharacterized protein n=1 Tax=marine sediment metagenome TaxID=412755 RepID=A0A0F9MAA9_9ZZZZ